MARIPFASDYHHDHSQLLFERIISYPVYTQQRLSNFVPRGGSQSSYRVAITPTGYSLYTGPLCASIYFLLDQYTDIEHLIMIGDSQLSDQIIRIPSSQYKSYESGLGKQLKIDHHIGSTHPHISADDDIHLSRHDISSQIPYIAALTRIKTITPLYVGNQTTLDTITTMIDNHTHAKIGIIFCASMGTSHEEESLIQDDSHILSAVMLNHQTSSYHISLDTPACYTQGRLRRMGLEYGYRHDCYMDCVLYSRDEEEKHTYRSHGSFIA